MKRALLLAAFLLAALFFVFSACGGEGVMGKERLTTLDNDELAHVERLYDRQCALCHGANGAGDGPASFLLFPPARDFTAGSFKLASTENGVPTEQDLEQVIERGMPGSAMPGFEWMSPEDRNGLAKYVRLLAVEGLAEELDETEALDRMTPGDPLPPIPLLVDSPDALARGKELYFQRCAACHGKQGEGSGDLVLRDLDATLNWARELSGGILKGGARAEDLARRIRVGMHGTAMHDADLSTEDVGAIVAHLQTLLPEDAHERGVRRRRSIAVARTAAPLPTEPDDPRWNEAEPVRVWLAPTWWGDDSVLEAEVAGYHDGEDVALRIRWPDAKADAPDGELPAYADAVAVQFSPEAAPRFFGMGPDDRPADIWFWKALDLERPDLLKDLRAYPHRLREWVAQPWGDPPVLRLAYGAAEIADETAAVATAGMKRAVEQPPRGTPVAASAQWSAGRWSVVLTRSLRAEEAGEVGLDPGSQVSMTLAVWNGANKDLRGQKSLAVWHELRLAP